MKYLYYKKINFYFFILCSSILLADTDYIVGTESGISIGVKDSRVILWEDIPYAKPPIDDLRWKAPRLFDNNQVTKVIKPKEDNHCIQEPSSLGGAPGKDLITGTEDCLYLDIRAPLNSKELLPVMFWIHGGGNITGTKDLYDFSELIRKHKVVVVTLNYRLGALGWFTHPGIQDYQKGIDKTSNFGTLDIIHALEWVKRNIDRFGGDPENVTIFGESAGGHNVLSLLVSPKAKGLFHKAISQSGYTTSIDKKLAFNQDKKSDTWRNTSNAVLRRAGLKKGFDFENENNLGKRNFLKSLTPKELYVEYLGQGNQNIPLLTNDGIVIPKKGLRESLRDPEVINKVPVMAGSNRDEVKLWLASAEYFVGLDFSFIGSLTNIPRVSLSDKDAFEAFNYYRSKAWQIRGVDTPLSYLKQAGNNNLFAYRFDWDDHRKYVIADFQELLGAAHALEIPLLTGNNKLVGRYGFLLYPEGVSKNFTSKNMMLLWTNFAKEGTPGKTTNDILWGNYIQNNEKSFLVIDKKKDMRIDNFVPTFKSLVNQLSIDSRLEENEKCVALFQMGTYVGLDIFDELNDIFPLDCKRGDAIEFIESNASFIDY